MHGTRATDVVIETTVIACANRQARAVGIECHRNAKFIETVQRGDIHITRTSIARADRTGLLAAGKRRVGKCEQVHRT